MDDPPHQSLPCSGFTMQQNGGDMWLAQGVERGQVSDLRA
jgi:hypothetical protein